MQCTKADIRPVAGTTCEAYPKAVTSAALALWGPEPLASPRIADVWRGPDSAVEYRSRRRVIITYK